MNFVRRQHGSSLLLSLVMLVVLTLLVVSAIRMSNTNLKTVGNMQVKNEAVAAAQQAIEQVMSSVDNFYTPAGRTVTVDVNGDAVADYTVTTSAVECLKMVPVPGYSIEFAESAPKDTYWDIRAVVTDIRTGASATLHQGARVRMDSTATC
jgi:Tfp pilus assembly protein PilX